MLSKRQQGDWVDAEAIDILSSERLRPSPASEVLVRIPPLSARTLVVERISP